MNTPRFHSSLALVSALVIVGCATHPKPAVQEAPAPVAAPVAPATAPTPAVPSMPALHLDNVYFEYGKADLRPEARTLLKVAVDQLLAEPESKIEIAGHCDERGTDEYNVQLGWKRAYAVRDYLVRMGIDEKRLFPISYGRARPAVTGTGEDAWKQNRRGEVTPR